MTVSTGRIVRECRDYFLSFVSSVVVGPPMPWQSPVSNRRKVGLLLLFREERVGKGF